MQITLTFLTTLLITPLTVLHAADGPKPNPVQFAGIDPDDGKTWSAGLMLDDRNGISYPDGQQTADGTIHLIWDFSRSKEQEIVMTTFREEDVLATSAETIARVKSNRRLVSKGGTPE
jgi:hypothetical protein